ncbi:MAG: hypothetical protein AAB795_00575 [Patescibacteria group bacterium]
MQKPRVGRNGHINRSHLPDTEWTEKDRRRLIDLFGDEIIYELGHDLLPLLYKGASKKTVLRITRLVEALQIINVGSPEQLAPHNSRKFIEHFLPSERDEFSSYGRCSFELDY